MRSGARLRKRRRTMTTLELPGQTADPDLPVKNRGGSKPKLTVPCWWGCGATVYHGILREHWMKCPRRPKKKGKR